MHLLIVGGTRDARIRASRARLSARRLPVIALEADTLAFVRPTVDRLAARPSAILVDDFERACPNMQSVGTRLVLTQSTYLVQSWIDIVGSGLERRWAQALASQGGK